MKKILAIMVALVICAVIFSLTTGIDLGENAQGSIKEKYKKFFPAMRLKPPLIH